MWNFLYGESAKEFPYEIQEKIYEGYSCFDLHTGKSKATKEAVSIFSFDKKRWSKQAYEHAKTAVKRLKTVRHPEILNFIDSLETDSNIYIATEYVEPLLPFLETIEQGRGKEMFITSGIRNVVRAVSFLNCDALLKHNNIFHGAIFVNSAGVWKLGELGYVSPLDAGYPTVKVIESLKKYNPPESARAGSVSTTSVESDSWGLGILIWEVYNGALLQPDSLKSLVNIPGYLKAVYCELVAASPEKRPRAHDVLEKGDKLNGFFRNELVDALKFLDEIHIKNKVEMNSFFGESSSLLDIAPGFISRHNILPQMMRAFKYGCDGSCLVSPFLKVSSTVDDSYYQKECVPFLIQLFSSNDRATRSVLLQNIEHIIDKIPSNVVNEQLFPLITNGFLDTNPRIREQTVKAMIHVAPKLNNKNLNEELLKHFARLQAKDEQGGIRTNTTVCLGKIAYCLNPQNRKNVLISAYLRALADPFAPVRNAGILALAASQQYFTIEDIARKVLPSLCPLTVDLDTVVRQNCFKTLNGFLNKLEKVSENPSLRQEMENEVMSTSKPQASWAEWAVSAIASKLTLRSHDTKNETEGGTEMSSQRKVSATKMEAPIQNPRKASFFYKDTPEKSDAQKEEINADDNNWDGDNWESIEDEPIKPTKTVEKKPAPRERKSEPKKHRTGPMKLGMKASSDKFE